MKLVEDILKRLLYYKSLGDKTFEQLEEKDFFFRPSPESNSIAIIIQHMYGNMMSRFSNFLTEDGEKSWRNRDAEFEANEFTRQDLIDCWQTGWSLVQSEISRLTVEDLEKEITIRGEKLYVYDALLRQLAHYPYHVGQIVLIGKMIKDNAWKNLSVPKGGSNDFNKEMMGNK
jgi:hypothetical protein